MQKNDVEWKIISKKKSCYTNFCTWLFFIEIAFIADEEEESSTEDDESNVQDGKIDKADKVAKETEAVAEISALVNYIEPVHFNSFESAESE